MTTAVRGLMHGGAKTQRAIAEFLLTRPATADEVADALGMKPSAAKRRIYAMRANGIPLVQVDEIPAGRNGHVPVWRLIYPRGRTCTVPGCGAHLSIYNPSDRCGLHEGWSFPWEVAS